MGQPTLPIGVTTNLVRVFHKPRLCEERGKIVLSDLLASESIHDRVCLLKVRIALTQFLQDPVGTWFNESQRPDPLRKREREVDQGSAATRRPGEVRPAGTEL